MKHALKILILFASFALSLPALASDFETTVLKNFETSYFDAGAPTDILDPIHSYVPLWCPENVARLLGRLKNDGVRLSDAKVLYLVSEKSVHGDGAGIIIPNRARKTNGESPDAWSFHVVLLLDGKILDFDYTDSPQWIDAEQYFTDMWSEVPDAELSSDQGLFVREIPAERYIDTYQGNWNQFLNASDSTAKAIDASTWLSRELL